MSAPKVVVRHDRDAYAATLAVLAALQLPDLTGKKILLKPNLGRLAENDRGIITRTVVIAAVIDFLQDQGYRDISLGDSPILGLRSEDIFNKAGVTELAKEKGITLLDFDQAPPAVLEIPAGTAIKKIKVFNALSEYDYLIDIPVMKMHMHTQVSLSLKNLKGLIWRAEKIRLHQLPADAGALCGAKPLDVAIADLSRVFHPDLSIVDATIAQEGLGPAAGSPREVNLVIGGTDYLAVDYVAAQLMGVDPAKVHHLRLARTICGCDTVPTVDPENYLAWQVDLDAPPATLDFTFPGIDLEAPQACSACMSTLLLFLKAYLPRVKLEQLSDKTLKIKVGKGVNPGGERELFLGNCTYSASKNGIFVKGCPPVSSHIFEILSENDMIEGEFTQKNL